jgi:hypothetical protein
LHPQSRYYTRYIRRYVRTERLENINSIYTPRSTRIDSYLALHKLEPSAFQHHLVKNVDKLPILYIRRPPLSEHLLRCRRSLQATSTWIDTGITAQPRETVEFPTVERCITENKTLWTVSLFRSSNVPPRPHHSKSIYDSIRVSLRPRRTQEARKTQQLPFAKS